MDVATTDKLLHYSTCLDKFGPGPKRPTSVGHCSTEQCNDAIGVRAWIRFNEHGKRIIEDIYWTGTGCTYCLATAAILAERLPGLAISALADPEGAAGVTFEFGAREFPGMPPTSEICVATAVTAFQRALWRLADRPIDWTELDLTEAHDLQDSGALDNV
jgi:hypothetical protein